MNEEINYDDIIFDIESIVKHLTNTTNVKFKLKNLQSPEYVATGIIQEQDLLDFGFKFIGYSSYVKCPIYRYGQNIEALFNDTILHIYDLRR